MIEQNNEKFLHKNTGRDYVAQVQQNQGIMSAE